MIRVESKAICLQLARICREAGIPLTVAPATNDILEAAVAFLNLNGGGGSSSSSSSSSGNEEIDASTNRKLSL